NEENIVPNEPHPLRSGDVIRIRNIQITFEIRDAQFEQKVQNLPVPSEVYDVNEGEPEYLNEVVGPEASPSFNGPAVIRLPPQETAGVDWQKHKMKAAIA